MRALSLIERAAVVGNAGIRYRYAADRAAEARAQMVRTRVRHSLGEAVRTVSVRMLVHREQWCLSRATLCDRVLARLCDRMLDRETDLPRLPPANAAIRLAMLSLFPLPAEFEPGQRGG